MKYLTVEGEEVTIPCEPADSSGPVQSPRKSINSLSRKECRSRLKVRSSEFLMMSTIIVLRSGRYEALHRPIEDQLSQWPEGEVVLPL